MAKPRKVRMQTKPKCGLCANVLLKEYDLIGLCAKGFVKSVQDVAKNHEVSKGD